jgi:O-antigen ligase
MSENNSQTIFLRDVITSPAQFSLLLFCLTFPFVIKISLLFLVLHLILTVKSHFNNGNGIRSFTNTHYWLLIIIYLLYLVSMFWTDNQSNGWRDLETKLGLIILPLVAIFFPRKNNEVTLFITGFSLAMILAVCWCVILVLMQSPPDADAPLWFYSNFSRLMHPTYFTMYLGLALAALLHMQRKEGFCKEKRPQMILNMGLVILTGGIMLSSSRAGIVIIVLCLTFWLIVDGVKFGRLPVTTLFTLVTSFFLFGLVLFFGSPRYRILLDELTGNMVSTYNLDQTKVDLSPLAHRKELMHIAWEMIISNPGGVGAGDVQDMLVDAYKLAGFEKAASVRYNPHNQYLQTMIATGILGGILLLLHFLTCVRLGLMSREGMLLAFIGSVFALNALFESVLEVQRGVLLYSIALIFLPPPKDVNQR